MKYNLNVNQVQALQLGITNINQAHIFDLLTSASTWATTEIVNDTVYYWVARQTIADELKLLNLKPDTVYRHLKSLHEISLIDYIKVGKKDCMRITNKGKKYLSKDNNSTMSEINPKHYVGNKSELDENSEINPTKLGNKSEKHSEINPTYHNTNINHNTNDNNIYKEKNKKTFSFTLSKKMQIENTSQEYQTKLKEYILSSGKPMSYEDFYNTCVMKGYQYKNFKLAYDKWTSNQASCNTLSPQGQNYNQPKHIDPFELYASYRQKGMDREVAETRVITETGMKYPATDRFLKATANAEYEIYMHSKSQPTQQPAETDYLADPNCPI